MNLMGVDLGIHKVAIFGWEDGTPFFYTRVVDPGFTRAIQLADLGSYTASVTDLHSIDYVWIEDTLIGNNRKYSIQLAETKGAVMSHLPLCDVRLVNVATWKKQVLGDGHASKEAVRDYIGVSNGAYAALCGEDQDLYDSCCIALYGRQLIERSNNLQLESG